MQQTDTVEKADEWLFGWDDTPGIVSVWADKTGRALVWRRDENGVTCTEERYTPFVFAATLADLPARDLPGFGYRELDADSDADSYRYLLTARDGRTLQSTLLAGAKRRLGKEYDSLHDLPDDYYPVGAVEQYLMQMGRVYFRGLAYADLHRLQFDLETTGLSAKQGRIFMVAVRDSRGLREILEARTERDEVRLITDLCALIRERDPDIIENHNLFGFDLPFLEGRAHALGIALELGRAPAPAMLESHDEPAAWGRGKRKRYNIAGRELIDTLDAVRHHDFSVRDMPGHGLKAAARYFGIASPERTYIAGAEIYNTYRRDPEQVRRYAFDDVTEVDGLSLRLMGAPFALAGMAPRRYTRVASAGPAMGILEPMLVRAYLREGAALPCQAAKNDALLDAHQGGATILYAAGIAQHVIKADVASMYPSIMRTFGIGPACDRLGVLLSLVDRLTDLRLHHKTAAKAALPDSAEGHHHNAVQAAMKIVVNAAYGYMAAGHMALFADRRAADDVTRRGREILADVVERLREQGMALLEADTDGVFFGVPLDWTEAQERALVADVAATLPPGIRLEYEGRYKAMLSHEVKNYALLTYGDELIMRGGAMRSSRSEPFGERFLRAALRRALVGDSIGLQQVYSDMVAALRERRLSVEDVAGQTRLSKTPDEYMKSRKRSREAQYEALLTAGRTHWRMNERVRFYKAANGTMVWLPDTPDDEPEDESIVRRESWPDYDIAHYLDVLHVSYISRLRKAYAPADFDQLFSPRWADRLI